MNLFSTKYQKYTSACPALPEQMRTQICSMDDLPCYNENACVNNEWDDDNEFEEESRAAREVHKSPPSYIEENVHQEIGNRYDAGVECLAGPRVGWPTNSPESPPDKEEDQGRAFCMNNSPAAKTLFTCTSSSYVVEEDPSSSRLIELTKEFDEPLDNRRSATALVADEDQALMKSPDIIRSREIEIIDLFTPSPCYAVVNSGRKKRRPTLCPEIIDLTNSPLYV